MKVYFWAGFDLKLECENESVIIKEGEIFFTNVFNAHFFVTPLNQTVLLPYTIDIKNGELLHTYACSKKIDEDLFVELKPFIYYSPQNLEIFNIDYYEKQLIIHYYNQSFSCVKLFYNNQAFTFNSTSNCKVNYFTKTIANKEILFVKLSVKDKEFYYIFKQNEKLFDGYIKDINIKDKTLILLVDDVNCYGEKRVKNFNIETAETNDYLIHFDKREICLNLDVAYLFLDAIMIDNFNTAKNYLSNDLKILDNKIFKTFFGEFDRYLIINNHCLLIKNGELYSIIQLTIKNNLIINISN